MGNVRSIITEVIRRAFKEDDEKKRKLIFSGVILNPGESNRIRKYLEAAGHAIPHDWETIIHHMTIGFGKSLEDLGLEYYEGKDVVLKAIKFGLSKKAMAIMVKGFHSENDIPHITIAVNREEGGKPYDSNLIQDWYRLRRPLTIRGIPTNVYRD